MMWPRLMLRVERGYGAFGRELCQEYIPLETGFLDAVSFTRAAMSAGRLSRGWRAAPAGEGVAGLKLTTDDEGRKTNDAESDPGHWSSSFVAPIKLEVEGEAGDLPARSSRRAGPIGLAHVRSAHAAPGGNVSPARVRGEVVELPFDPECSLIRWRPAAVCLGRRPIDPPRIRRWHTIGDQVALQHTLRVDVGAAELIYQGKKN